MITLKQIEIYNKYSGDGDSFILCATSEEKSNIDYEHWSLIDNILQDLILIKEGLVSDSFIQSSYKKMIENCENEETIQALKKIGIK